jgi:hypothetical protein
MRRVVKPELLDDLPPSDPRAIGSRADLRRVNFIMGHAGIRSRALRRHYHETDFRSRPLRLIELGAGDGTLLLRLARSWAARGVVAEVTLLDRQNFVSAETLRAFAALHWSVTTVAADVFNWLEQPAPVVDVMFANLFLHEFPDHPLRTLLRLAAARANLFIACEPRRSRLTLTVARLLGLVGCNRISRHDGIVSVRAGFAGAELSALWPAEAGWELSEQAVGWFSHGFVAKRNAGAV